MKNINEIFTLEIEEQNGHLFLDEDKYKTIRFFRLNGMVDEDFSCHEFLDWLEQEFTKEFMACQEDENKKPIDINWYDAIDVAYANVIKNYNDKYMDRFDNNKTILYESDGYYYRKIYV